MNKPKLTTELFALPHEDEYIIYAPLKHIAFIANAAAAKLLHELEQGKEIEENDEKEALLEQFEEMGIVNGPPDVVPPKPAEKEFAPTTVILFPTSDCNLRCVYCYASAGENPRYMRWEIAKAAIDLVIRNARAKQSSISVGFHGNGEPTLPWQLLKRCVTYAKEEAQKHNARYCQIKNDSQSRINIPKERRNLSRRFLLEVVVSIILLIAMAITARSQDNLAAAWLFDKNSVKVVKEIVGNNDGKEQTSEVTSQASDIMFRKTITDAGDDLKAYPERIASGFTASLIGGMLAGWFPGVSRVVFPLSTAAAFGYQLGAYRALDDAGNKFITAREQWLGMSVEGEPLHLKVAGKHLRKASFAGYTGVGLNAAGTALLILSAATDDDQLVPASLVAFGASRLAFLIADTNVGSAGNSLSKLKGSEDEFLALIAETGGKLKTYRNLQYIGKGLLVGAVALFAGAASTESSNQQTIFDLSGLGAALGGIGCVTAAYLMPYLAGKNLSGNQRR